MPSDCIPTNASFEVLDLDPKIIRALRDVGYESPSPIQAATIPALLAGRDVLGQAQTGTGKTAAFALPVLSRIDHAPTDKPQALVLTPTRELAIQVAEAFQRYAAYLPKINVLPIYGGQSYGPQLQALRRGVQVVVGTPGRVIDHLRKGTLNLSGLRHLVLDEADEMLRMGFIDDVEQVLQATPSTRQVALFSATMPKAVHKIAKRYLQDPAEITIKAATTTAPNIRQRYWFVSGMHKLDAMTRILEVEPFDAMIVFAHTKKATEELAEKLAARGLAAAAINGDMTQARREHVIAKLKDGRLDILVATDVAARGLDVDRISHVLNYHVPYDTESYIHRIGRTGRAGRMGEAILFVSPREKGMLHAIERASRHKIEEMKLPTVEAVNNIRIAQFKQRISDTLARGELDLFQQLIEQYEQEHNTPAIEIAAALAHMAQNHRPLLLEEAPTRAEPRKQTKLQKQNSPLLCRHRAESGKVTYRIEVGHEHGVKPGNIIGAIINETGLERQYIGRLSINQKYSLINLPENMHPEMLQHLKKAWVAQQAMRIRPLKGHDERSQSRRVPPARRRNQVKRGSTQRNKVSQT